MGENREEDLLTQIAANTLAAAGGTSITGTYTDRSVTGTGAGTKVVMAANPARKRAYVQNPGSAGESIFLNFAANATPAGDSIELAAGEGREFFTTQEIRVLAPNGAAVTAKELA